MGINGALTTAVSGLRAQSFALENISGNIANSQTTAYKRTDTSFADLVLGGELNVKRQLAGSVSSFSRATNEVQGTLESSSSATALAIKGSGYVVVQDQTGEVDGKPVFGGDDLYTRRGDFEIDKNGYLTNGTGFFLKGIQVDSRTGNPVGSVPEIIQFSNDFYPAEQTTQINYAANLPTTPRTNSYVASDPSSWLLGSGFGATVAGSDSGSFINSTVGGDALTVYDEKGGSYDVQFRWGKVTNEASATVQSDAEVSSNSSGYTAATDLVGAASPADDGSFTIAFGAAASTTVNITGGTTTIQDVIDAINAVEPGAASYNAVTNEIDIASTSNITVGAVTGSAGASGLGLANGTTTASVAAPATEDTWALYYLSDGNATGADVAWTKVDADPTTLGNQNYQFDADGQLVTPADGSAVISSLTINGVNLGDIALEHGASLTQFADSGGAVTPKQVTQDGTPSGELIDVEITDGGTVSATYSNGKSRPLYKVPVVTFSAENQLAHIDGGAYAATNASGLAIQTGSAEIVGQALEGSNVDIADEFTKMIVTQQAYSANTRVITTADSMAQEALSMVR